MDFFAPGRTEIIGNHTDHQLGRVIASSVSAGMRASAQARGDGRIRICSGKYRPIYLDISDLSPRRRERGKSTALIRGVLSALKKRGYSVGGFSAKMSSELKSGGGLSSSAAFTVLIGRIISGLYNAGAIDAVTIAECGQEAENLFFGKPSGLMDQLACSVGKTIYIDFLTREILPIDCDFGEMGLVLCLTDTGGSHSGLTEDYASIPEDMRRVAESMGKPLLGYVNPDAFFELPPSNAREYRLAEHFFRENERVALMREAMIKGDGEQCIRLMNESGRSSEEKLRNITSPHGDGRLAAGLELSAKLLDGTGAWRVHGGGFAGCVQALMPADYFKNYAAKMSSVFGAGSCIKIM